MMKKIIYGCDARGDGADAYMIRWTLLRCRWGRLYLHRFLRSDADVRHDHPWPFISLILWRGYIEDTPAGRFRRWPGQLLRRPADHVHRVELVGGQAWTLVWAGRVCREWGFHTLDGWECWRRYFERMGCR